MKRTILACVMMGMTAAALGAQQSNNSNAYEGVSHPPPDSTITAPAPDAAAPDSNEPASAAQSKPAAGKPLGNSAASIPAAEQSPDTGQSPDATADSSTASADPDAGVVGGPQYIPAVEQQPQSGPQLDQRLYAADPDGDVVQPPTLRPGELAAGVTIRTELIGQLSTKNSVRGDRFRSRVASDVLQNGQVLIPAGAELDGEVAEASGGHLGGHGTLRLRPETLILPNGTRYELYADLVGTPDARARVNDEGTVHPESHIKRDTVEYGVVAGGGATTGAILAGPAGALAGGLIGTGVVTVHLLVNHPEATLKSGTTLLFTLAEPLQMAAAGGSGN